MLMKGTKLFLLFGVLLFTLMCVSCKKTNLTPEEMIVEIYCEYINSASNYSTIRPKDVKIKYYLGKYNDAYCAIIEGDAPIIDVSDIYVVNVQGESFNFQYIPEIISVYHNNNYYHIIDACNEGILSLEDVKSLYRYFNNNIY